uniref:Dickkopf 1/2/4-A protein n=1 Tax=Hydra vulgaris TaxID=6087 RepID=Q2MCN5_HYDVU|nr:Dickkopf 1/2/4-A protein [Hydra vulgaris]
MRFLAVFLVVAAFVAFSEAGRCNKDADCENGCCVNYLLTKQCNSYVKEGELCGFRDKFACGCEPGLECVKVRGTLTGMVRRCVDNSGSGSLY